jgi:hypothetical protein
MDIRPNGQPAQIFGPRAEHGAGPNEAASGTPPQPVDQVEFSQPNGMFREFRKTAAGTLSAVAMTPLTLATATVTACGRTEIPESLVLAPLAMTGFGLLVGPQLALASLGAAVLGVPLLGAGLLIKAAVDHGKEPRERPEILDSISENMDKVKSSVSDSYAESMGNVYEARGYKFSPLQETRAAAKGLVEGVKTGIADAYLTTYNKY